MTYAIALTDIAKQMLKEISDRRIREKLAERIDQLANDPELQGKPLQGTLAGYRSVRAVGQRYRIIYNVQEERVIVNIVGVGIRKGGILFGGEHKNGGWQQEARFVAQASCLLELSRNGGRFALHAFRRIEARFQNNF